MRTHDFSEARCAVKDAANQLNLILRFPLAPAFARTVCATRRSLMKLEIEVFEDGKGPLEGATDGRGRHDITVKNGKIPSAVRISDALAGALRSRPEEMGRKLTVTAELLIAYAAISGSNGCQHSSTHFWCGSAACRRCTAGRTARTAIRKALPKNPSVETGGDRRSRPGRCPPLRVLRGTRRHLAGTETRRVERQVGAARDAHESRAPPRPYPPASRQRARAVWLCWRSSCHHVPKTYQAHEKGQRKTQGPEPALHSQNASKDSAPLVPGSGSRHC